MSIGAEIVERIAEGPPPPMMAFMADVELSLALIQSRAPLMVLDWIVKFNVAPGILRFDQDVVVAAGSVVEAATRRRCIVRRLSVPDVLTTFRLSSKPPSISDDA